MELLTNEKNKLTGKFQKTKEQIEQKLIKQMKKIQEKFNKKMTEADKSSSEEKRLKRSHHHRSHCHEGPRPFMDLKENMFKLF